MLGLAHPQPRLGYEVPERQRLGQLIGVSQQVCLRLLRHDFHRGVIDHQVMA